MLLLAAATVLIGYWLTSSSSSPMSSMSSNSNISNEIREAFHTGFLRGANRSSNGIRSEETKMIFPNFSIDPLINAMKSTAYVLQKNNILGELYSKGGVFNNMKILRVDYSRKPRLPELPNKEAYGEAWSDVPNVTYDRPFAATPPENKMWLNRDQYGHSGGAPRDGRSYLEPNIMYYGNPWGAGGEAFKAVGNQHFNVNFTGHERKGILKRNNVNALEQIQEMSEYSKLQ